MTFNDIRGEILADLEKEKVSIGIPEIMEFGNYILTYRGKTKEIDLYKIYLLYSSGALNLDSSQMIKVIVQYVLFDFLNKKKENNIVFFKFYDDNF